MLATPSTSKLPQGWCGPAARLDNLQILNHPQHASQLSFICLFRRRWSLLIRRAATTGNSAVYDKVQAISSWKTTRVYCGILNNAGPVNKTYPDIA